MSSKTWRAIWEKHQNSVHKRATLFHSRWDDEFSNEKIEQEVSSYYLADEIRGIYRGMMIAIPPPEWQVFEQMSLMELTQVLQDLADRVNLTAFVRHPRTQKETRSRLKRHRPAKRPHISTAKILSQA